MPSRDLSGVWRGYYTQHGQMRPICAVFEQDGGHLSGRMNDEVTGYELPVSEMCMEEGLPPGTDERIVEQVRELLPGARYEPVMAEVELPADSLLDGEVDGDAVRFLKVYQGRYFTGYRVGSLRVGIFGEGQEVHYRGLLSPEGNEIEGQWLLHGVPEKGMVRTEGAFVLRRETANSGES
jgi:hypothetical protein